MLTNLNINRNQATEYMKINSSTRDFSIKTIGQFFTYLKDNICSIFNTEHKFACLKNKSIPEFNLKHIENDLTHFLTNPNLNNPGKKDQKDYINYSFDYINQLSGILPNLNNIYSSGCLEPNELITQLYNFMHKAQQNTLNESELKYKNKITDILKGVNSHLININTKNTITLSERLLTILNT